MQQYLDLLRNIRDNGEYYEDRTGVGRTGLWAQTMRFNLNEGFPILTTKHVPLRWVAEELFWMLSGSTYEPHLAEKKVDIWKEWATPEQTAKFGRKEGELGPVYGHAWRNFGANSVEFVLQRALSLGYPPDQVMKSERYYSKENKRWINTGYWDDGVDQIKWIIEDIQKNPFGTRKILCGWDAREQNKVALPPCHTVSHFKVNADKSLSSFLYQRSADCAIGVPFNISSYALLTHLISHVCDLKVREFVHQLGDAHLYSNHINGVNEQLSRTPYVLPFITISDKSKGGGFNALMDIKWEDLSLTDYKYHPKIYYDVAV